MRFLAPSALREVDARALEELLARAGCVVAAGEGEVRGLAAAALFFSDYAALTRDAVVSLDAAETRAAIAWRTGDGAWALEVASLTAGEALARGLCDEIVGEDPEAWFVRWMGSRSEPALDAAALLIRSHGGDELEREVFADLFATGEPQRGMREFLAARRPGARNGYS